MSFLLNCPITVQKGQDKYQTASPHIFDDIHNINYLLNTTNIILVDTPYHSNQNVWENAVKPPQLTLLKASAICG